MILPRFKANIESQNSKSKQNHFGDRHAEGEPRLMLGAIIIKCHSMDSKTGCEARRGTRSLCMKPVRLIGGTRLHGAGVYAVGYNVH